jgi:tRNA(Phe) wybutosine-synthesizing methylase Tyw3
MNIPTSMGGKRRVHTEGLKMLDEHYSLKEEKLKMQSMENRIKRLEFEE